MIKPIEFEGHSFFNARVLVAVLSEKAIRISNIRTDDNNPGLRDFEVCLLRLVEAVTNGTRIEISYTGTSVLLHPGTLTGPPALTTYVHKCPSSRGLSFFLEPLLWLMCFAKHQPVNIVLSGGVTSSMDSHRDISVDLVRVGLLPVIRRFGIGQDLEIRILQRGFAPLGNGKVHLVSQAGPNPLPVKSLSALHLLTPGRVNRIRGIAYSAKINSTTTTRLANAARGVLNPFVPDTFIYSDSARGSGGGGVQTSPGWGICLVAETTKGMLYCAEIGSDNEDIAEKKDADDAGTAVARFLLEQVSRGGCVDAVSARWVLLGTVLGEGDVSQVNFSSAALTDVGFLDMIRSIHTLFGIQGHFAYDSTTQAKAADGNVDGVMALFKSAGWVNSGRSMA